MVVIVGAGLAGLVCARILREAGHPSLILERDLVPGGRVRTERHPEGFLLDRGFQVLFTAYPAARRHLSYSRLDLQPFAPGALIARDGALHVLADPLRAPGYLLASLRAPLFPLSDKLRVLPLARACRRASIESLFAEPDGPTDRYLLEAGFSQSFVDQFARPFYGGIFLDRSLSTSSAMFRFTFKMLSEGDTVLPAGGMQEISEQLVRALPMDAIRYDTQVARITYDGDVATGVETSAGEPVSATAVVIATDPPAAAHLLGDDEIPHEPVACTCVYFAATTSLYGDRLIVLNANADAYVNNLVQLDNVAPRYAPAGQHLLSLTILNAGEARDEEIERRCRAELAALFPGVSIGGLRLLRIVRIPFAQFAQPPGIYTRLARVTTSAPNVYLASEALMSSSIQGAMAGGEAAARQILQGIPATAGVS